MLTIDLNCDMGEGTGNDEAIMPCISSANIACGYHAGDEKSMWKTVELAIRHHVAIGAHVSFLDRDNFGRSEMDIPLPVVYDLVIQQLLLLQEITDSLEGRVRHVKPHGALYNMSAKDPALADMIAKAVKEFDPTLLLFGLSNSHSIQKGKEYGLQTAAEVFADRTYQDDGTLTPRQLPGALIEDGDEAARRVLHLIKQGTVKTLSGKEIPMPAETICLHGDGVNAAPFARRIHDTLKQNDIDIEAINA